MRLLAFTPRPAEAWCLPRGFEAAAPLDFLMISSSESFSADEFLALRIPLMEGKLQVRWSFDEPLSGAVGLEQIHSAVIHDVGQFRGRPLGDGLVVRSPLQPLPQLSVRTADCLPVAIALKGSQTKYALVHAGWRGYCGGIHLSAMESLLASRENPVHPSPSDVDVFVGPAIFGCTYRCGSEVRDAILRFGAERLCRLPHRAALRDAWEAAIGFSPEQNEICHPDFQLLAACDFIAAGVPHQQVHVLRENTWGSPILFSYRESCRTGRDTGRRLVTHLGPCDMAPPVDGVRLGAQAACGCPSVGSR